MQIESRIPKLTETSFDGALMWFFDMHAQGLLFHPEDDPANIFEISDNTKTFSDNEVSEVRIVLDELENNIGHGNVIEAAYPVFMHACGLPEA